MYNTNPLNKKMILIYYFNIFDTEFQNPPKHKRRTDSQPISPLSRITERKSYRSSPPLRHQEVYS